MSTYLRWLESLESSSPSKGLDYDWSAWDNWLNDKNSYTRFAEVLRDQKLKTSKEIVAERAEEAKRQYNLMKHSDLKFINLIGIELEGGWDHSPPNRYTDYSVKVVGCNYSGEIASKPSSLEEIREYVKAYVPKYVDESCGVHVHVSFKDSAQSFLTLMDKRFYDFFLERMEDWGKENKLPKTHPFWKRLKGDNKFCKRIFHPEKQVGIVHKSTLDLDGSDLRYSHLNYCYSMHGTIECRLFPGLNDPDLIISAVEALLRCYESFLTCNFGKFPSSYDDKVTKEQLKAEW